MKMNEAIETSVSQTEERQYRFSELSDRAKLRARDKHYAAFEPHDDWYDVVYAVAIEEGKTKECFEILLSYYDKLYLKSLNKRENLKNICTTIVCENVGGANIKAVLSQL